jgi:predicted MFS family arabinose efflux permease
VVAWLATFMSWRWIFVLCGSTGLIWALAFYRWFRDEPRDHPAVTPAERDMIEAGRVVEGGHAHGNWTRILRAPGIVPLCIQYFANSYGYYFFITWLPEYLRTARGMQAGELAIFAGLPMMLSAAADISGGMTTDFLARKLGVRNGYRLVGCVAYALAAVIMASGAAAGNGQVAGLLIAIAGALSMFTLAPAWATALGIGGENAGLMGAVMNTSGQIGSILSPLVLAQIVTRTGDWSLPLYVLAGLYGVAAVCWVFVRPKEGISK